MLLKHTVKSDQLT